MKFGIEFWQPVFWFILRVEGCYTRVRFYRNKAGSPDREVGGDLSESACVSGKYRNDMSFPCEFMSSL